MNRRELLAAIGKAAFASDALSSWRGAGAFAAAALFAASLGAASAATRAVCEQQYAAKKAAGQTGAQSKAAYVKACLAVAIPPVATAQAEDKSDLSVNKLREAAENPVADLVSVTFQDNPSFNYGPYNGTQNVLNFQPVIPFHLNDEWNLIARPVVPLVTQPGLAPGVGPETGLGNIEQQLFLSPAHIDKLFWGVGPVFYFPTATGKTLGVNAWGAGPDVVVGTFLEPWVLGVLANNVWAWRNGQQVNQMTVQYFINYNMADGWYLCSQPIIAADWLAPPHDKWTVPFGGGFGRLFKAGKLPINFQIQAFYNAVRPTVGPLTGPVWSLRFELKFLFPVAKL